LISTEPLSANRFLELVSAVGLNSTLKIICILLLYWNDHVCNCHTWYCWRLLKMRVTVTIFFCFVGLVSSDSCLYYVFLDMLLGCLLILFRLSYIVCMEKLSIPMNTFFCCTIVVTDGQVRGEEEEVCFSSGGWRHQARLRWCSKFPVTRNALLFYTFSMNSQLCKPASAKG
jgi:hypothetical protein